MKCQIAVLETESCSCLHGFLQNANLQEMHQEHSAGSLTLTQKEHHNLGGKMRREKTKNGVTSLWNNEIIQ